MSWKRGVIVAALLSTMMAGGVAAEESVRILTYPLGLVLDELEVEADLGAGLETADLFLDGEKVCSLTADEASCTVDLGPDPHVHLLELVGQDGGRAERWLNRPGEEAELDFVMTPPADWLCAARIRWAHPQQLNPVRLEVALDGMPLQLKSGNRAVTFPCPQEGDVARALVASAVFADGRRVEAVALIGGFTGSADVALTAVSLVSDQEPAPVCEAGAAGWPLTADRIETGGFQVVIVLDPGVAYQFLQASALQDRYGADNPWLQAERTLADAELLWYVAPDEELHRVDGFAAGRSVWLDLLFRLGMDKASRPHRIADAVAASGLVAGAGPYRRAVVLLLGDDVAERDDSVLTPAQARGYLAEVGVPLVVLRNGKRRDDGWPAGLAAGRFGEMADGLQRVRQIVDRQCVTWFGAEMNPQRLAEVLPEGVRLAGRGGEAPGSPEAVWARADLEATEETIGAAAGAIAGERIDVTDITILVNAVDSEGDPVRDLKLDDLHLLENGVAVDLQALKPVVSETWIAGELAVPSAEPESIEAPEAEALPVTIYVDRTLGGSAGLRRSVAAVTAQVDRLAVLGPVEVVVAEGEVGTLIGPTRDVAALTEALEGSAGKLTGRHAIERIRRGFMSDARKLPGDSTPDRPADPSARLRIAAIQAAGEENQAISRSLDRVREWAGRQPGHRAGLLVLVGTGFDEDPAPFYLSYVEQQEPENVPRLREDLRRWRQEDNINLLGRQLAASGWRVVSVAGDSFSSTASTQSAEFRGGAKMQQFKTFSSDIGARDSTPDFLLIAPLDPLRHLARPSGGDLVVGETGLAAVLDGAAGWYRLTYQVSRPPDGVVRDLEIESRRSGISVTTSQAVASATPESQADGRVLQLLGPTPALGDLTVALAVGAVRAEDKSRLTSRIDATVDLTAVAAATGRAGARLRISVAVAPKKGEPTVVQRREELPMLPANGEWIYTFPVQWPKGKARIAVVIEDLATGLWGGTVVDLPTGPRSQ